LDELRWSATIERTVKALSQSIPSIDSPHPQALKNYQQAIIEPAKLIRYALNPNHPIGGHKARVFQSALGFHQGNWRELEAAIRAKLPSHPANFSEETPFGKKYEVYLPITGLTGRTVEVLTVWQYDTDNVGHESEFPRLITA
jgi:hypothetical protein